MKKITIVAHALSAGGGISVGRNLIYALQSRLDNTSYQLFVPEGLNYEDSIVRPDITQAYFYKKQNIARRFLYDRYFIETQIRQFKPDLILCLGNRGVDYRQAPQFLLCHDPHLFYPSKYYARETPKKKLIKWWQRHRLAHDLKNTATLFLQTKVAAQRVRAMYNFSGEIVILPNAVSRDVENSISSIGVPNVLKEYADQFRLFYLTRYYPHKNLELLVELFDVYRSHLQGCKLFITIEANQHPLAEKLLADIVRKGLQNSIINLGPLEQSQLPGFFSNVDALLMPTTLESFSGTYLEAMNFSCPILTSDLDFAQDICGDAAIYFNPWSAESLFSAINRLRTQPSLKMELQEKGVQRLQAYGTTWEENGTLLASAIHDALNKNENN